MTPIIPNLPYNSIVRGELYGLADSRQLDQDLLEVELSTGVVIDVGWYPRFDPQGEYQIKVHLASEPLRSAIKSKSLREVLRIVQHLAQHYSVLANVVTPSSTTDNDEIEFHFDQCVARSLQLAGATQ